MSLQQPLQTSGSIEELVVLPAAAPLAARTSDLVAGDDAAAMSAWLREFQNKPHTLRAYRREARRFLMWLSAVQRGTLADLTRQDLADFAEFLAAPPASWLPSPRPADVEGTSVPQKRSWVPLQAPMSAGGRRRTLIILQAMLSWLVDEGYISRNPARLIRDKGMAPPRKGRDVPDAMCMTAVLEALREHAEGLARGSIDPSSEICRLARRDALVWAWIYYTGARRHEFAEARCQSLTRRRDQGAYQWWWLIDGKGDQLVEVPAASAAIATLAWFFKVEVDQLVDHLRASPGAALLPKVRGESSEGIGGSEVYESLRRGAAVIADLARELGLAGEDAAAIHKARPHDLRAFRTTHLLDAGVDVRDVQRLMRHKDINTTLRYDHRRNRRFHAGIESASPPSSTAGLHDQHAPKREPH